jgi:aminoglycoside phosphotransferase (APT) family kinase protein
VEADTSEARDRPRTSTRDLDQVHERLTRWFAARGRGTPVVGELSTPTSGGMSSETVLFQVDWPGGRSEELVARLVPAADAVPVFPSYDLGRQARIMDLVRERTRIPVPRVRWYEPDPGPLGSPFIVMDRVRGAAPPDLLPYNFVGEGVGSWLADAPANRQRALQDASVAILAELHGMDASAEELSFLELDAPGDTPLRRHVHDLARYYDWVRGELRIPVIERAFSWIDRHWPEEDGELVVSWGDSRVGNILFEDFRPVAVLDWEMAALGPRELDLGWMIFMHSFFEHAAELSGFGGMPGFLRRDDVAAEYERAGGAALRDLPFYETYAALRHGIVMSRVTLRAVHFGEAERPDDPDEMVLHHRLLREMTGTRAPRRAR